MAIDIVDLPMNSMVIFHGYVSLPEGNQVVQRNSGQSIGPGDRKLPIWACLKIGAQKKWMIHSEHVQF